MITYSNENADALLDSLNDNIGIPEFKNRLNEVYLSSDFHILKAEQIFFSLPAHVTFPT